MKGWFRHEALLENSGKMVWGDVVVTPTIDAQARTQGYVIVVRDMTEQHEAHAKLLHEALTDPLTGLFNRRGLERWVAQVSRRPPSGSIFASWIVLDIDHFKTVNDRFGHDAGDEVLRHLAALLKASAREGDVVARLGGEEFAIMLPGVSLLAAVSAAERLRKRIEAAEIAVGEACLHITASFGVALQPWGPTWGDVVSAADKALYQAKAGGRNQVVAAPA